LIGTYRSHQRRFFFLWHVYREKDIASQVSFYDMKITWLNLKEQHTEPKWNKEYVWQYWETDSNWSESFRTLQVEN
jgi:hypothetical protein